MSIYGWVICISRILVRFQNLAFVTSINTQEWHFLCDGSNYYHFNRLYTSFVGVQRITHTYTQIHTPTFSNCIHRLIQTHKEIYTYKCMYFCVSVRVHIYVCACICARQNIYIHTYIYNISLIIYCIQRCTHVYA